MWLTARSLDRDQGVPIMRMGIDIGGTFTDLLLVDDITGDVRVVKVLTDALDPARGVMAAACQALEETDRPLSEVEILVHGTTLATNTIIERKGSLTALLATEGHRDAVEMRREHRYEMYDVLVEMPTPLAPRHLRFDVEERMSAEGAVIRPLNEKQVECLIRRLSERGVEAVAVCFLHSYHNLAHELAVRDIAQRIAPGLHISLSSQVAPGIKEFERASTTLCNAYIHFRVAEYLGRLEEDLVSQGFRGSFFMMQSSGGLCSTETARESPVRILESGPAGGVLAASHVARLTGMEKLLSFDMGGTTAKLAVVEDSQPSVAPGFEVDRIYRFTRGGGLPVQVPTIEMIEIGAGGGSIARVDPMGLVRVGPESAGAEPGPACYGRGGQLPTVTDADLLLGYLDANYFLGGDMVLDVGRAQEAVARCIAEPLGLDIAHAAWAIHRLVNENMASAALVHMIERGKDPGAYPLFAFGGAGPVHAYGVATILRAPGIVVPFGAGVASSLGFLTAPLSFEFVQGWYGRLSELEWEPVNGFLENMEREGRDILGAVGLRDDRIQVSRSCDMRYHGQGFEVRVPLPPGRLGGARVEDLHRAFEERYRELYGRTVPDIDVEVMNWRVTLRGPRPELSMYSRAGASRSVEEALKGSRRAYFPEAGGFLEVPVFERHHLPVGSAIEGPAIVEERESTLVLGLATRATVDAMLNLLVDLTREREPEVASPERRLPRAR